MEKHKETLSAKIIRTVNLTIDLLRDLQGALSVKQIREVFELCTKSLESEQNGNDIWEARQYFMRKYSI